MYLNQLDRSSMDKYSSVNENKTIRNQKIQMNMLERKLLTGRYDQTEETGKDLNGLKIKTDYYKAEAIRKADDTEKMRRQVAEVKR